MAIYESVHYQADPLLPEHYEILENQEPLDSREVLDRLNGYSNRLQKQTHRAKFEAIFPIPNGVVYSEESDQYHAAPVGSKENNPKFPVSAAHLKLYRQRWYTWKSAINYLQGEE